MRTIKTTEEIKAYSEVEAKEIMEKIRSEASEKGYTVGANGYTFKEKRAKGEVVDVCWIVKIVKIYGPIWEEIV